MAACVDQPATCSRVCSKDHCVIIKKDKVDFQSAEERCHAQRGELMTFHSTTDDHHLQVLSQKLDGDFWIGLRLPARTCSDLSAPLRGYEWTSGNASRSLIVSWRDDAVVCSPRCVSLSNDGKWTERACSDPADGFLCQTHRKDAFQTEELSDPEVFRSAKGCSDYPCEHLCTEVQGGYKCSCYKGYAPDKSNRRLCKIHCATKTCAPICDRNTGTSCRCADGFILNEKVCEDIDECDMQQCDQDCANSFGSFVCSCRRGYALKGEVKCVRVGDDQHFDVTTPILSGFVKPATKNSTLSESSRSTGGFFWIWICVVVAVVVIICVVRFYVVKRQKRRQQSASQSSNAALDNMRS